jgi:hypothetical protein
MVRRTSILLAGFLLLVSLGTARPADAPPLAGTWKFILPLQGGTKAWWLVKFENKDDKWTAAVTSTVARAPEATLEDVKVTADAVRFTVKLPEGAFQFEAKVPKDNSAKILGTISSKGSAIPAEMERTTLTSLDDFEINKETVATKNGGVEVVLAAVSLLGQAEKKKAKVEEVRSWADKAVKSAEAYGPRWHREILLTVTEVLTDQDGYAQVALRHAQQAERLLDDKDRPAVRKRTLEVLAKALEKVGKEDDAKEVQTRILKIDFKIKPEPFTGRKSKSDRAVLVELFTGAQCPPCVAADLAFDALGKTFKPSEAILLQYHLHIPDADPLANKDTLARQEFYDEVIKGTPTLLLNGKTGPAAGGTKEEGPDTYDALTDAIAPLLEQPAKAKVTLTAAQKGTKIDIKAEVSDLAQPGDDVRLRLVLVEEEVAYTGANKLATHHHVVRDMPGGPKGIALPKKTGKQEVTVDLDEVRKKLDSYVTKFGEKNKFHGKVPEIDLKKLSVVAFVQNDETHEVFQAVQVEVKAE